MAKLRVSDETPIGMATMQAHTIAATHWPDDRETNVLETVVEHIGAGLDNSDKNDVIVTLPDNLYENAIQALATLNAREVAQFKQETFEITRALLKEAQMQAAVMSD